ncbi:MAG: tyrosine--tRNA ligase [Xanthomonadaceae bacterium]|nr:tyrosine--tRNA ligase [Xanthomonadaceae bacterium]
MSDLFQDLSFRGLVHQTTDPLVEKAINGSPITLYAGFDPTADSLHLGSLLPLLVLKRFQLAGHSPIAVVGGATGMVGDPSGKSAERNLQDETQIAKNLAGIRKVIEKVLAPQGKTPAKVANNADWMKSFSFLGFLRDVGKHFSVNVMLGKDSVKLRLEDRDQGISYTEFSYMLLQAYDFYYLNKHNSCALQVGGSDQWGNITAGTELIRRIAASEGKEAPKVFGLTFPLVMKADGTKFGKTEAGTIWLSAEKTSPYQLYQYLLQTSDADVMAWVKYFTFLSHDEIRALEEATKSAPHERRAQKALASSVTEIVHGAAELAKVIEASAALFSGDISKLDAQSLADVFREAPTTELTGSSLANLALIDALVETKLATSRGNAKKDLEGGGISVNGEKISDLAYQLGPANALHGKFIVLRKGKKNYHVIKIKN